MNNPLIGVICGSPNDMEIMCNCINILEDYKIPYQHKIISAHRTPKLMFEYAETADRRGLEVIIAGAGGAAHLPGMIASMTLLPVLGVPIPSTLLNGMDSLLSIVQMPAGTPVGCLAIGIAGARNAALLAIRILAIKYPQYHDILIKYNKDHGHE